MFVANGQLLQAGTASLAARVHVTTPFFNTCLVPTAAQGGRLAGLSATQTLEAKVFQAPAVNTAPVKSCTISGAKTTNVQVFGTGASVDNCVVQSSTAYLGVFSNSMFDNSTAQNCWFQHGTEAMRSRVKTSVISSSTVSESKFLAATAGNSWVYRVDMSNVTMTACWWQDCINRNYSMLRTSLPTDGKIYVGTCSVVDVNIPGGIASRIITLSGMATGQVVFVVLRTPTGTTSELTWEAAISPNMQYVSTALGVVDVWVFARNASVIRCVSYTKGIVP